MTQEQHETRIAERLTQALGEIRYQQWFGEARLHYRFPNLEVAVDNRFKADWIQNNFNDALLAACRAEYGPNSGLVIRVEKHRKPESGAGRRKPAVAAADTEAGEADVPEIVVGRRVPERPSAPVTMQSRLIPRHELTDYVVGPGNELAYAACIRIAEEPGCPFNPLFLHGPCGVGKTHLLQGVCGRFGLAQSGRRWMYTTAEQFMNQYVEAMKENRLNQFRAQLRKVDLLVMDDVHFLTNKTGTQTEFQHTFDTIAMSGAKLVMASDCHPRQIKQFSNALVSRFLSGMVAEIKPLEGEARVKLVMNLAARRGMKLVHSVAETVAQRSKGAAREIEGLLTTLRAVADLAGGGSEGDGVIGHALLNQAISGNGGLGKAGQGAASRPIRLERILEIVCRELGVDRELVLGGSRHRKVVLARSATIYLARQMTNLSYPDLARAMKRPNHSTVVTAWQRFARQIKEKQPIPLMPEMAEITTEILIERLREKVLEG